MARIMAFDYGLKRTGIAVSDVNQLIATGLTTVVTHQLLPFIKDYTKTENIEAFVFGNALHLNGAENAINQKIKGFAAVLHNNFPNIALYFEDERYTSKQAVESLVKSGVPKQKRTNKALIDEVSATLILQQFMQTYKNI